MAEWFHPRRVKTRGSVKQRLGGVRAAGAPPDLQNRCDPVTGSGGFDSRPPPPTWGATNMEHDAQERLDPRRRAPSVATMLADPRLQRDIDRLGTSIVKNSAQTVQQAIRDGKLRPVEAIDAVIASLPERASSLRPVHNATGVIVHTNLGRAPLSCAAVEAMVAAAGYTDVELDLGSGRRARRGRSTLSALR